jgi:hypothetical protein
LRGGRVKIRKDKCLISRDMLSMEDRSPSRDTLYLDAILEMRGARDAQYLTNFSFLTPDLP